MGRRRDAVQHVVTFAPSPGRGFQVHIFFKWLRQQLDHVRQPAAVASQFCHNWKEADWFWNPKAAFTPYPTLYGKYSVSHSLFIFSVVSAGLWGCRRSQTDLSMCLRLNPARPFGRQSSCHTVAANHSKLTTTDQSEHNGSRTRTIQVLHNLPGFIAAPVLVI